MNNLFIINKKQIETICKSHFVKELAAFGSVNTEKFNDNSDIDFLYQIDLEKFTNWATAKYDYTDNIFSLEKSLTDLFRRKVDLVPSDVLITNKFMKEAIENTKSILYAA